MREVTETATLTLSVSNTSDSFTTTSRADSVLMKLTLHYSYRCQDVRMRYSIKELISQSAAVANAVRMAHNDPQCEERAGRAGLITDM